MLPLDIELSDDQIALLKVIHGEFEAHARWPIWQFVDLHLRPRGTASRAIRQLPTVGGGVGVTLRYGLVNWQSLGYIEPPANEPVGITVAGLHRIGFDVIPQLFIRLVQQMVRLQEDLLPSPTTVVTATVSSTDLRDVLFEATQSEGDPTGAIPLRLTQLRMLLKQEPWFWSAVRDYQDGTWDIDVPQQVSLYAGVESVADYLERLTNEITAMSPLVHDDAGVVVDLPRTLEHLDAIWKAKTNAYLFARLNAGSVVRLAEPVNTADEFNSAVSALSDTLANAAVPPDDSIQRKNRRPISALAEWLRLRLPTPSSGRVNDAIDTLERIVDVRTAAQHDDARHKAVKAFEALGLTYPPSNWAGAWHQVSAVAVQALEAIREEVQASLPDRP